MRTPGWKNRILSAVLPVALLFTLYGCAGKTEEAGSGVDEGKPRVYVTGFSAEKYQEKLSADRISIAESEERYKEDTRALRDADLPKLHFENCVFADFPETDQLDVLELDIYDGDFGVEQTVVPLTDSLETVKDWLARTGQTDELDLKKTLHIYTDRVPYEGKLDEFGLMENGEPPEDPLVYEHLSQLDDKLYEGERLWINEETGGLLVTAEGIMNMGTGRILDYVRSRGYDDEGSYEACVAQSGALQEMKDRSYPLLDGELSVGEGAKLVKDYLEKELSPNYAAEISVDSPQVEVFRLPDGVYGYRYLLQMRYRNVPFTMKDGSGYYSGDYMMYFWDGDAYVADGSGVCSFDLQKGYAQEKISLFSGTEMLSLFRAAEQMSQKLASMLNFDVASAGLVYLPVTARDDPDGEISGLVLPCWEFVGTNRRKQEEISAYVDAFTGELYYYTDQLDR